MRRSILVGLAAWGCGGAAAFPDAAPGRDGAAGDATDVADGALADAGPADAAGFARKDQCAPPLPIADYAGDEYASRPVLAAAPTGPIVAIWNKVLVGSAVVGCAGARREGSGWSAIHVLSSNCETTEPAHLSAGGEAALVAWAERDVSANGRRTRITTGWTDVAGVSSDSAPYLTSMTAGAGGHGAQVWRDASGVHVGLISPAGAFLELPVNALTGAVDRMAAVVDATGGGVALWIDGAAVHARAFTASAWGADAVALTPGGALGGELAVARLPDGGVYAIWIRVDGTPGTHGATFSAAGAWSAIDDLASTTVVTPSLLAAASGELTVAWRVPDGNGGTSLVARRRAAGVTAFGAATPLGAPASGIATAIDAAGDVTVARNTGDGRIFHHRIAAGASAWQPEVRVDSAPGLATAGSFDVALAIDPATGDPIVAWITGNDLGATVCR